MQSRQSWRDAGEACPGGRSVIPPSLICQVTLSTDYPATRKKKTIVTAIDKAQLCKNWKKILQLACVEKRGAEHVSNTKTVRC